LLIASIARAHNLIVATGNEAEFSRLPELIVENWTL
jgi:predicted nucleic acid-binding protein